MIEVECDECENTIENGEKIYCEGCYEKLIIEIENLESTISDKDSDIEELEDKITELEDKIKELESEKDG